MSNKLSWVSELLYPQDGAVCPGQHPPPPTHPLTQLLLRHLLELFDAALTTLSLPCRRRSVMLPLITRKIVEAAMVGIRNAHRTFAAWHLVLPHNKTHTNCSIIKSSPALIYDIYRLTCKIVCILQLRATQDVRHLVWSNDVFMFGWLTPLSPCWL